jgi:hypothetical protein
VTRLTVREAVNGGLNFFAIAGLAIYATGALEEVFAESEWVDRADDIALIVFAAAGIV